MKFAVFSNLWPPIFIGGYEIGASHIVAELRRRGHEVMVLSAHEYQLFRGLEYRESRRHPAEDRKQILDVGMCVFGALRTYLKKHKWTALKDFVRTLGCRRRYLRALRSYRPDVMLAFNPLGVLAPVLDDFVAYSRESGAPVCAYVSDHWVAGWPGAGHPLPALLHRWYQSPKRRVRLKGKVVRRFFTWLGLLPNPMPLLDHYFYCSKFIQTISRLNSSSIAGHTVVHWGLPGITDVEPVAPEHFTNPEPLTLVFAGQILEHKGLPVIIRALPRCQRKHKVVVIGDDQIDYVETCRKLANKLGVADQVQFVGRKNHEEMLSLLRREGQVLIVPSMWDEPFSIVVLEGMGVGLPVIASATGGTPEGIRDGENGFLFRRGNSKELAIIIDRLEADRGLCQRVSARARRCVLERFTMEKMVDQLLEHMKPASRASHKEGENGPAPFEEGDQAKRSQAA